MSYLALARKYRPQTFEAVAAQKFVTSTLQNAISMNRVAHAYLFTGPRGVGKTTTARIFAKALNCLTPKGAAPCGECENCLSITDGTAIDVVEIDGASNRGVDEIRALRETVKFMPVKSKYKVYIVDEVHMLTKEAFNALLKTLEEPPQFVLFIFATTDSHKIPATILSRCQRYEFTRIPPIEMMANLKMVLEKENIKYDDDAIALVIRNSDGCMRDALSILDQIIAYSGGNVDYNNAAFLMGVTDKYLADEVFAAVLKEEPDKLPALIEKIEEKGMDYKYVIECLIENTKHMLNYATLGVLSEKDFTSAEIDFYSNLKKYASQKRLYALFQIFQRTVNDMKYCDFARYVFEFSMFKGASLSQIIPLTADVSSDTKPQTPVVKDVPLVAEAKEIKHVEVAKSTSDNKNIAPDSLLTSSDLWQSALKKIESMGGSLANHITYGEAVSVSAEKIVLAFPTDRRFQYEFVSRPSAKEQIQNILSSISKPAPLLEVIMKEPDDGKKKAMTEIPAQVESYKERKLKKAAKESPFIVALADSMGAEIESIEILDLPKDEDN